MSIACKNMRRVGLSPVRQPVEPLRLLRSHSSLEVRMPASPSSPSLKSGKMFLRARGPSNPTSPANRLSDVLAPYEELRSGRSLETISQSAEGYYRLGVELAQGAEGDVFAAVSVSGGYYTQVAAKRIRVTSASHRRCVLNEVQTALLCRKEGGHNNVIRHLDWFPGFDGVDREIYLIIERCDFGLDDLIRTVRETRSRYERIQQQNEAPVSCTAYRLAEAEVSRLLKDMALALDFLNTLGIVHQDIKTENILWKHTDVEGSFKICDFGVVGFSEPGADGRLSELSSKGKPGTLWTQAPEVLRCKRRDASCDVWSLGCVLYEVTYLEKPFNSIELMAYSNDMNASLPDPFPPVRARKEATRSPTQKLIKTPATTGFAPATRRVQRWVYSPALKSLVTLCLTVSNAEEAEERRGKILGRPTPRKLQESEEYAATLAVAGAPWKQSITSTKFYQALLTHYKDSPGDAIFTLLDEIDA